MGGGEGGTHLRQRSPDPNGVEDGVGEESLEHVPLAVDLPGVDLVEQGHHHERVEDDGEVLRRLRAQRLVPARRDVQHLVAWTHTAHGARGAGGAPPRPNNYSSILVKQIGCL